jgi:uncharacterized protein (TIGR00369 family)
MEHPNDPVARMPATTVFGFRFLERDERSARVALPLLPEFLQGEARVHGGILATLADTAAVYLLIQGLGIERTLTSIEFKLNFTRPATLERGEVVASAKVVKKGRTVALADVEVEQAGALIAKGLFTYLFAAR